MAGAGYKLFATGDVLTAAQVNTYLMQQTVMVFASSAARTTALSGVLAEGMVSYLQDTNTLEVYDGAAWVGATGDITGLTAGTGISISSATGPVPTVAIDTAVTADLTTAQTLTNKTLTSPVLTTPSISNIEAKGDILVGTADNTLGIIAAGSNGDTLVADSSATTGLRWQGDFAAGKNKIINGDFNINQRGFTSTTTTFTYGFDRWLNGNNDGTVTTSAQTFTAGSAPVAGYEATNFLRQVTSGQTATSAIAYISQRIEDVRTFAGQTVTLSFWAKAASGTPKVAMFIAQNFGTSGSSQVEIAIAQPTITTSWARYSATFTLPSISGKTIGTGSSLRMLLWTSAGTDYNTQTNSMGIQSNTFDFWGVQLEAGSVATAFQTATGTLQGELSACQRYYWRFTGPGVYSSYAMGYYTSTTAGFIEMPFPVTLRGYPSSIDFANLAVQDTGAITAVTALVLDQSSLKSASLALTVASGGTSNRPVRLLNNNNAAGYIGISAEL